jgi:hypothetical protein
MEHKKDNVDPAGKSTATGTGDTVSKTVATEEPRAARAAVELDEPDDDGVPEPAHPLRNMLREYRIENMMSKAELAR